MTRKPFFPANTIIVGQAILVPVRRETHHIAAEDDIYALPGGGTALYDDAMAYARRMAEYIERTSCKK